MSLYREVGRGRTARITLAAALSLLVGIGLGFAVGRATQSDPDLEQAVAALRSDTAEIRNALELVTIEYAQAVDGGEVAEQTEYEAATADVERAREAFAEARADLASLAPEETAALGRALDDVSEAVSRKVAPTEVEGLVETAEGALDDALPAGPAS